MQKKLVSLCLILIVLGINHAQQRAGSPSQEVKDFILVDSPTIALTHARVIDGTGVAAKSDQTIIIMGGKIQAVGDSASARLPEGAKVIDLAGKSGMPGLVMMNEHIFCPAGKLVLFNEMGWSFPRLYLASGLTPLPPAGSVEPYTDLNIKRLIDTG